MVRSFLWREATFKRVFNLAARFEQRATKDRGYIARHPRRQKKVVTFLRLAQEQRRIYRA
jgi:hypothetical protein